MDNRVFNVNGRTPEQLLTTLQLAFGQCGSRSLCEAWVVSKEHGLILLWCGADATNRLPSGLTAEQCLPMVTAWLASKEATQTSLTGWDSQGDHDGSNILGWRVYCEDWGHVAGYFSAICAIKPAYLWFGK